MRVLTLLLIFMFWAVLPLSVAAQITNNERPSDLICAFHGNSKGAYDAKLSKPSAEALQAIQAIADATGLTNDFVLKSATFPKVSPWAYAQLSGKNRNIVYDVDRFYAKDGKLTWEDLTVLAHEVGHHVHSHTAIRDNKKHHRELASDRFAGFAISRLGGTLENALFMTKSFPASGSKSHPSRAHRIAAITQGWTLGERMKRAETGCKTQWISEELYHEGKLCRYAVRCSVQGRVVKQACEDDNGKWDWSQ